MLPTLKNPTYIERFYLHLTFILHSTFILHLTFILRLTFTDENIKIKNKKKTSRIEKRSKT